MIFRPPLTSTSRSPGTISMHSVGQTIAHFEQPIHFSSRISIRPRNPSGTGTFSYGYRIVAGFEMSPYLSESKDVPKHEIPATILALSGKRVAAEGYMAPLAYEAGGAKKFLLLKDPFACCFAVTPKLNEWIEVTMQGGSVAEYVPHVLVRVTGVLRVQQEMRGDMAVGLYKLEGTSAEFTDAK